MPGKVPQQSSGAPKRGAGASLGKRIAAKGKIKPSPPKSNSNSSSTNNSSESSNTSTKIENGQLDTVQTDTDNKAKAQELKRYNDSLNKYNEKNDDLAFMKDDNFENSHENTNEKISISELNEHMASSKSLASRIASATGRNSTSFGSGRSRLPGDDGSPRSGDNVPDFLPRFALTRSQLYLGYDPKSGGNNNAGGGSFTSRIGYDNSSSANNSSQSSAVSNVLNGTSANSTVNFEAYSSAYLKSNAPELSRQFETDPNFKSNYLKNVEKLYNGLDVRTLGNAPVEANRSKLVGQAGLATSRDKQQVANSFMTLLAKSDSQVDKIANRGLTVFMADSIVSQGENVAGYFSTDNHMVLSRNPGFASFNATAVHELTHVVDFSDGSLDGHINGLANNWSSLRADASSKIAATGGNLPGIDSGFANYSQTNDMEFLAVMTQLYQSDTADLQKNLPQVFNALDRMFRVV